MAEPALAASAASLPPVSASGTEIAASITEQMIAGLKIADDENAGAENRSVENAIKMSLSPMERFVWFPIRPGEPDCSFFLRTGSCKFGPKCRYNHPRGSAMNQNLQKENEREASAQTTGKLTCKYYLTQGGCKFGKDCMFVHCEEQTEVFSVELNFLGLPLRPGGRDCPFYMQTGSCKFATRCKYHHPDPIAVSGQDLQSGRQSGGSPQVHAPTPVPFSPPYEGVPFYHAPPPYVPGMILPSQGPYPNSQWTGYQASQYPLYPPNLSSGRPTLPVNDIPGRLDIPVHHKPLSDDYPERPGQKECSYFMKTGDCKFKSACKFHHPKSRLSRTSATT